MAKDKKTKLNNNVGKKEGIGFSQKLIISLYVVGFIVIAAFFAFQSGTVKTSASSVNLSNYAQNIKKANTSSVTNTIINSNSDNTKLQVDRYDYEVISKSESPKLYLNQNSTLALKIKNTGNKAWVFNSNNKLSFGPSRPIDRNSIFYKKENKGWLNANRIAIDKKNVLPGETANFLFDIVAPGKSGIYREFFSPVVEGVKWLNDKEVYWDIEVRDPEKIGEKLGITINGSPIKYIYIKLSEQMLYAYENGLVKYRFQASSGLPGMDTPKGKFQIYNKYPTAYSKPYNLYMDNWMAISADGAYGIHSLPYWLVKGGKYYEGEDHLGSKVSHGCVRVGIVNSKTLYNWSEVGIPVFIED